MLYLFWGLLNIALFLFFIVICFKATKLIREKIGIGAAVVFVFGLLSFVAAGNDDEETKEPVTNVSISQKFVAEDTLQKYKVAWAEADLDKNLMATLYLRIQYRKAAVTNIPIYVSTGVSGFVSGTDWIPISMTVNPTNENGKFEFGVHGTIEWRLLGFTIYSQSKVYEGFAFEKTW